MKPILNRVVLKEVQEDRTAAGLIVNVPGDTKNAQKFEAIAVGPGLYNLETGEFHPCQIKVGDHVWVNPYLGMRCYIGNQHLLIQKEEEILFVE